MNESLKTALELVRDALRSGQNLGDQNKADLSDLKKRGPAAVTDVLRRSEQIQQYTRQGEGALAGITRDYQATEAAKISAERAKQQEKQRRIQAEQEKARIEGIAATLGDEVTHNRGQVKDLGDRLQAETLKVGTLSGSNDQLAQRVSDAQRDLDRINGELGTKNSEIAELQRRNGEAGGRYSAVCAERDRLHTERDAAQEDLHIALQEQRRLLTDQGRLNRENGQLEGSNKELQSQNKYNKKWNVGLGFATAALVLYAIASPFTGKSNAEAKPAPVVEAPKYNTEKNIIHIEYRVGDKWARQNEAPTGALESRIAIIVGEAKEPTYVTINSVDAAQTVFEVAKKARENGNKEGGYLKSNSRTEFYPAEYVSIFSAIAGKTEDGELNKPSKKDAEYTMLNIVNKGGGFAEITGGK